MRNSAVREQVEGRVPVSTRIKRISYP
jgi:hypothetical protein